MSCGCWNFTVEIVGLVDAAAFLGEVVAPVVVEVAVAAQRAELEHGFGAAESQRAPVMSMRSLTRWRTAPSMTPVAIGQPLASAVS